jgi:Zn-dependent M16 (insulinase) family peptidase
MQSVKIDYFNSGVAHSGHHYAMSHAASKLEGYPAAEIREKQGGLAMVRFLSQLSK